ncbi:hypothetical protein BH18ACI2_BH18ACI2_13910 [soil metagenome]
MRYQSRTRSPNQNGTFRCRCLRLLAVSAQMLSALCRLSASRLLLLPPASCSCLLLLAFCLVPFASAQAQARRVVIIKVDGLSSAVVESFVHERDPRTGRSKLPWFKHIFYERGTRVENFYVRGMSLSGPSWSMLDTGQHLQIKGNVEFDRYTLHSYDYLNFIPFWLGHAGKVRVDMPGAEVLDELGVPLLMDAYPYDEQHISFQLFQRGARWTTLQRGLQNRFTSRQPRELFDEWLIGFESRSIVMEQLERELLEKLNDPRIRYLDFYTTDFDHAAHHNRDRGTHLDALQELDSLLGRIWTAIQKTELAAETALVVVSDHGTNTDERIYSQGFNLVKLLAGAGGGGHHVITKRRLLNDYSLKGFYPLVPLITTTTPDSYYLKGKSADYPSALVDFDGNERTSIHLRDSDLNVLHILLQQLQRTDLPAPMRRAVADAFFKTIERCRTEWQHQFIELREEIDALHRLIERQRTLVEAQPKNWTQADSNAGRDQAARRLSAQLDSWQTDERKYREYARTLGNLLALRPDNFAPSRLKIPDLIGKGVMGEQNSIHELQNYVIGLPTSGLALAADGSLDWSRSFLRLNYPRLLHETTVRNNVQPGVANRPVDFVAMRIPTAALSEEDAARLRAEEIVWLYRGADRQALLLARHERRGQLFLRLLPIAHLTQAGDGTISFDEISWTDGLPLNLWEDRRLVLPGGQERAAWLGGWHSDLDWLRAAHLTEYANAVVGLHEQFSRHLTPEIAPDVPGLSRDEQLIRRFRRRQRQLVETDLLVLANNHWNFDVRGFNPGGNHGSFFRVSTHSTLMLAGGEKTLIPRAFVVAEPYDSLSFVPTVLALTGRIPTNAGAGQTTISFQSSEARAFPGRIIEEIFAPTIRDSAPAPVGAATEGAR